MATLQERNGSYRILFRHGGRRHTFTIGKVEPREADLVAANVDHVLMRIEQRLLKVPPGVDLVAFVQAGGQVPEPKPKIEPLRLRRLRELYVATHEGGAMEKNSLATIRIHLDHIEATLGARAILMSLGPPELQRHIDRRRTMKGNGGRTVSPTTIQKELASFRAAWNWAIETERLDRPFPSKGLVYPKLDEKEPFRTYAEIERMIQDGGLGEAEQAGLWNGLFLTLPEITDLLEHVRAHALHPWIYPMFALAAHTGARRSEILRSRKSDFDFEAGTLRIREKKRSRKKRTTRRVPLSPPLARILRDWFASHPGGVYTICQDPRVRRSRKVCAEYGPVTVNESNDHFRRTLAGSKWSVLRGWHVLRHSFASNCAARGVDQRIIDDWLGHTTEEMQKLYRHELPDQQADAIRSVFPERQ